MKIFLLFAFCIVIMASCKSTGCAAYGNYERNRKIHSYIKTSEKNCKKTYVPKKYKNSPNYKRIY